WWLARLPDANPAAAIEAGGKTHFPAVTLAIHDRFDGKGQMQGVVVARQGDDADLLQARLVVGNEALDGRARLLQGVVYRRAHVVEVRQTVVRPGLYAAGTGAEHACQVPGYRGGHRVCGGQPLTGADLAGQAFEQTAVAHRGLLLVQLADQGQGEVGTH